jgi:CDP-diacylglycerol pyrophosphatase
VGNISLTFLTNENNPYDVKTNGRQYLGADLTPSESLTKQQIFEKVRRRMAEAAANKSGATSFCAELNPDVIVISDDRSLLFEPQNMRASELLHHQCGLGIESVHMRERIRVHPCQGKSLINDLTIAGLTVV